MAAQLCPAAQLVASQLKETPEAAFLMDAAGIVLYENPPAKRLIFETTDEKYDNKAGDPQHSYHFSFLWTFSPTSYTDDSTAAPPPVKSWQNYFNDILKDENDTSYYNSPNHRRYDVADDGLHQEFDIMCKRTNGTEFPANLRLSKVGFCPCCEDSIYLVGYVKAKTGAQYNRFENPFAREDHSLKCILNASFDPVFSIDESGNILLANEASEKVFGYTAQEFVGNNISMICGGGHAEHHDEYIRNYLDTGAKKIIDMKREVPARRKDGTEFPVELGVKEISCDEYGIEGRIVFCAFIKDLSKEKQHEQAMKQKMELMQGMINASFDPLFQIDVHGIIQIINEAALSLFGYKREEMIGQNISIICGKEHADKHDQYIQRYLQTGQKRIIGRKRQVTAQRKGGIEFEIELGVREVVSDTGDRLFCGFVRDLTQQNLEKRRMRKHEQTMRGNFFGNEKGTSRKDKFQHTTTM